jgi:hypothetical protein
LAVCCQKYVEQILCVCVCVCVCVCERERERASEREMFHDAGHTCIVITFVRALFL